MSRRVKMWMAQIVCSNYSPTEVYETVGIYPTEEEARLAAEEVWKREYYGKVCMPEPHVEDVWVCLKDGETI